MASLKDLKTRISSVQSTRRITSAMKMVAAAKLKRAQEAAEAARPFAERMERMLGSLAAGVTGDGAPKLLAGTGDDQTHLLVVVTSDRGLCGGFNGSITRAVKRRIEALTSQGKTVKVIAIGRKGVAVMRREYRDKLVASYEELMKPAPAFEQADEVVAKIVSMFEAGEFDVCTLYYNKFISALTQEVTPLQLIPFSNVGSDDKGDEGEVSESGAAYEFEPNEEEILEALLPKNLSVQVFRSMLESFASEQGARMTAMDNATRNAGDMINSLSITYNRARQAQITKELIEIISGAEAL
ncbi:F0F1 ATP synthase subunit gamma [Rhodospirillaceae bacterium KN72]|uniref:ATP synthase gamma chain n=1 Tax=Pacificispira spongiicola TaxID=2729598 RepID=A0A7Y0E1T4_9PROT|nr:F0F1 ATP synthase subunit gamma [Pacificispira spongiicola]NMM45644.1 F0F1 ATP synthase subunit gamma [Pacificispira spongiicola]